MARIIIYGDINIAPLYMCVNDSKELVISGKWPRCIHVSAGTHYIYATTEPKVSRFSRALGGNPTSLGEALMGMAAGAVTDAGNTTLSGNVTLDDDDVLLLQMKVKLKYTIYHRVVDSSEVGRYVDMKTVLDYKERAPGEKNKWVAFFLCLFFGWFGAHRFYEKKIGTGFLYLFTFGLLGFGVMHDLVRIWRR